MKKRNWFERFIVNHPRVTLTFIFLIMFLAVLTGCSSAPQPQRIDMASSIDKCVVFNDHYECKMIDGNTWTVSKAILTSKTIYDRSAWK